MLCSLAVDALASFCRSLIVCGNVRIHGDDWHAGVVAAKFQWRLYAIQPNRPGPRFETAVHEERWISDGQLEHSLRGV